MVAKGLIIKGSKVQRVVVVIDPKCYTFSEMGWWVQLIGKIKTQIVTFFNPLERNYLLFILAPAGFFVGSFLNILVISYNCFKSQVSTVIATVTA